MKGIKLISFSGEWCPPCRATRDYVNKSYDTNSIDYVWADVDEIQSGKGSEELTNLYYTVRPRTVPTLVVVDFDSQNILDKWAGLDRGKIDSYVQKYKSNSSEEE